MALGRASGSPSAKNREASTRPELQREPDGERWEGGALSQAWGSEEAAAVRAAPARTYCVLHSRPHRGFVLEHGGHFQEGGDHLLWVRGRQVLYEVVLLSATKEALEIQLM